MKPLNRQLATWGAAALALVPTAHVLADVPDTLAFVNVSVLPMDGERVLERQTVFVAGDASCAWARPTR